MDWSDPALNYATSPLQEAIKSFTSATLSEHKAQALLLFDDLRACRVTLEHISRLNANDILQGKILGKEIIKEELDSNFNILDEEDGFVTITNCLIRKVDEFRSGVKQEYDALVPQNKKAFEAGFDQFIVNCINKDLNHSKYQSWFEHQVMSGMSQPQLWKVWVIFQKQLRNACEEKAKDPLPPPLFGTNEKCSSTKKPLRRNKVQEATVAMTAKRIRINKKVNKAKKQKSIDSSVKLNLSSNSTTLQSPTHQNAKKSGDYNNFCYNNNNSVMAERNTTTNTYDKSALLMKTYPPPSQHPLPPPLPLPPAPVHTQLPHPTTMIQSHPNYQYNQHDHHLNNIYVTNQDSILYNNPYGQKYDGQQSYGAFEHHNYPQVFFKK